MIIASKSPPKFHLEETSSGSAYIPNDSWIYPAMLRLYSLGYVDTIFLSLRPWTRLSVGHALLASHDSIVQGPEEAKEILASLEKELDVEIQPEGRGRLAAVALANKLARFARAVLTKNETYRPPLLVGAATA